MSNRDANERDKLYPCDITLKVIGYHHPQLQEAVTGIVRHHFPHHAGTFSATKSSSETRYLSLSVDLTIPSREMLEAIFTALKAHPLVLFVL